jgi:hypothetical protein
MAYINQEKKATLSPKIKAICKKYGITASVAIRHHSTLVLNIRAGKLDFISNWKEHNKDSRETEINSINVNPYYVDQSYSGECKKFLDEVLTVMNDGNWDKSDIQTDYFNVGWYVDVNIGRWDTPYNLVKE